MARDGVDEDRGPGRPKVRERSDRRITVRFRYHCDQDLIDELEKVTNASQFIRESVRARLKREGGEG